MRPSRYNRCRRRKPNLLSTVIIVSDSSKPPYPPSLTVKSWEKCKGIIARISGAKTGVTEMLKKAEKQFNDAPWEKATAISQLAEEQRKGPEAIKLFHRNLSNTYQPKFRELQQVYADLTIDLAQKAKTLESDPKLVKFAPVLKKMSEDANKFTFAVSWGTVSDRVQKEILKIQEMFAERAKKARSHIEKIGPAIDKVINKLNEFKNNPPTPNAYEKLFSAYHRLPGTFIGVASKDIPEVGTTFKEYMTYASNNWTKEPAPKTDMAKMVKKDIEVLENAKKLIDKI